jgi:succinoglycan biosynthesis transport protein ExoP
MASTAYSALDRAEAPSTSRDEGFTGVGAGSPVARRWLSILIWLVLALGAALAYLAWSTPLYTAYTSVLLDARGGPTLSDSESSAGRVGQDPNLIESQLRLVSSPAVLARVVESQRLREDPEFYAAQEPVALKLREFLGEQPDAALPIDQRVMSRLAERLRVTRSEAATIIDIGATSSDAAKAARLADAVAAAFIESQAPPPKPVSNPDGQLDARLRQLEAMLRVDERRLDAFRAKHPHLALDANASDDRQLGELSAALLQARGVAKEARAKLEQTERAARSGRIDVLPASASSAALATLRGNAAEAQRRMESLAKVLGPNHPDFVDAQQRVQATQALVRDELRRIAVGVSREVELANFAEASALRALEVRQREVAETNNARAELRNLEGVVQSRRADYDRLLLVERRPQEVEPVPSLRLLTPALVPLRPSSPDVHTVLIIALAVGLGLGLVTPSVRDQRGRIRSVAAPAESRRNEVGVGLSTGEASKASTPLGEADTAPKAADDGGQPRPTGASDLARTGDGDVAEPSAGEPEGESRAEPPIPLTGPISPSVSPAPAGGEHVRATAQLRPPEADKSPRQISPQVALSSEPGRPADLAPSRPGDGYVRRFHLAHVTRPAK